MDHKLVFPFDVDNGSLGKVSPEEAFALGVEWAMFRARLENGQPFTDLFLANNAARLEKLAERLGRFSEARASAHGWTEVWVGTLTSGCAPPESESK